MATERTDSRVMVDAGAPVEKSSTINYAMSTGENAVDVPVGSKDSQPDQNNKGQPHETERNIAARENENWLKKYGQAGQAFADGTESVAILFADLVGSTAFKHGRTAIDGIKKSYNHNTMAEGVIESAKWGGEVVKFLGDGVMAFFGGDHRSAMANALGAANEFVEKLNEYNAGVPENDWAHRIQTRVGISFGPVWMMKFKHSDCDDPQGPNVDFAARLGAIAPPMHSVVTENDFNVAGGKDQFPHSFGPQSRRLQGFPDMHRLMTVTPGNPDAVRIPFAGSLEPLNEEIRKQLRIAESLFVPGDPHRKDCPGAENIYRAIRRQDKRCFESNYKLAELLVLYHENDKGTREARLTEAHDCLCDAKAERPQSCYVWKLLSWVQYQRFLLARDNADNREEYAREWLDDAYLYADHARLMAEGMQDKYGAAVAMIYLVIYLTERVRCKFDTANDDRQLADRYVEECQLVIDNGLDGMLKSNFYYGKALTQVAANPSATNEVLELIDKSIEFNRRNRLATRLRDELLND